MEPPDFELGPFATLYEEWILAYPEPRDPAIEERLAEIYRSVWAKGDPNEQSYVGYFILDRRVPEDADILLEGIVSSDFRVASHCSATLSVFVGKHLVKLGSQAREACRAMALNHPQFDVMRFPEHRSDDGWPEGRPFIQLYEKWKSEEYPHNPTIEQDLLATCGAIWTDGDALDKAFVLNFLGTQKGDVRPHYLLQGLASEDHRLSRVALFQVESALIEGYDFGDELLPLLDTLAQRLPVSQPGIIGCRLALKDHGRPWHEGGRQDG